MPTVVLDAYSKAYPSITLRLRASVFLETDPSALVATIIEVGSHPTRIWHFPGLPRANYGFSLDVLDAGGTPIQNLALFATVPGQIDGQLTRKDEQIKVGTTPGFDAGLQTVVFDGTGGKPNYIGWSIVPSELTGRGILEVGLDYSWDPASGTFTLLQVGDILANNTTYNIHFDPGQTVAGGSVPTVKDYSTRLVTATGNIDVTDFGNNIIVEPVGSYIELTLPDITTIPQGRDLQVETSSILGASVKCVKILPNGADTIAFLRGNIFILNNESLVIYRFRRPDLSNEWRVRPIEGNFKNVGQLVSDDAIESGVFCKQLLDGSEGDVLKHARIYNEHVLNLPAIQVCNFDDWSTGNNHYLYSLANSSDPGNAGKFMFPERRDLYERNNSSGKAGDFQNQSTKFTYTDTRGSSLGAVNTIDTYQGGPFKFKTTSVTVGTETRPVSYLINKFVLL